MSEQNNTMEKFLQYLEKLNTRLDKLEDLFEISEDGQKRKQERVNAQKAISLKNQQKVKVNNAVYPLTECGVIPYPIAVGNTTTPIPLNSVDNSPNQVDGFPAKFGMSLEDGSGLPVTLAQINACLYTASIAATWFTTGQIPTWSQVVVDKCGGYNKNAVIRVYDATGYFVYYQSNVDNNINDKPTLESHVGWDVMYFYECTPNGTILYGIKDLEVVHAQGQDARFVDFNGNRFKDVNMSKVIGDITRYSTESGSTKNRILTLSNGTIISMQEHSVTPNQETTLSYANSIQFKEIPFVIAVPNDCILPDFTQMPITWRITEQTTGHVSIRAKTDPNVTYCGFVIIAIGTLANYVGDELAKIRAYKVTPYYNKLTKNQKQELDQYYISLDETKDLTKVIAPEWLELELEGKELA